MCNAFIPIRRGTKRPLLANWNLKENAVTAPEDAHKLAGHDIALAHAYSDPPTACLDIDDGKTAFPYFDELGIDLHSIDAPICWSGNSNRFKYFFRLKEALPLHQVQIDGVMSFEYRCQNKNGTTVADVVPPSIHPTGKQYEWLTKRDLRSIPDIPSILLDDWKRRLAEEKAKYSAPVRATFCNYEDETPRRVTVLRSQLDCISPDCSYEEWRDVVFAILSTGWSCAEQLALTWSERSDKFNYRSYKALVDSYDRNRSGTQGVITKGTIYHYARLGGYRA